MGKKTRTLMATMSLLAGTTVLEAAPLPGFALTAQTPHFAFYTRGNARVDAEKAERYLAEIQQVLGQRISGRAEYYRYGSAEEVAAGTGTYAAGVTFARARQIHSTQEFHAHEIVHLVAGQLGDPGAFFHEGLAVALGNQGRWNGKSVDAIAKKTVRQRPLLDLIATFDSLDPQVSYPVAGSFVGSLVRAHGAAKVAEFFRASAGRDARSAFEQVFGRSLDHAAAEWQRNL